MEMHNPVATNVALWFVMLSPLIGLFVGLVGAWLLS